MAAEAIELRAQLKQRFTMNNVLTAPSLAGLNLENFAIDVYEDLTRDNNIRLRDIKMHGVLRYLVNREVEQMGNYRNYQITSIFTNDLMKVATGQDKQQYQELAKYVNMIITRRHPCPRSPGTHNHL